MCVTRFDQARCKFVVILIFKIPLPYKQTSRTKASLHNFKFIHFNLWHQLWTSYLYRCLFEPEPELLGELSF